MKLPKQFPFTKAKTSKHTERAHARIAVDRLRWQLGEVLDLSESGMCVRLALGAVPAIGSIQKFNLRSGTTTVEVLGRIQWLSNQRRGSSSIHAGIRFIDLSPEQGAAIFHALRHGDLPAQAKNSAPRPAIEADVEVEDLYAVLGISRTATGEQLKQAFRTLAQTLHPDHTADPAAHARFTLVHKSYSVLKDPSKRQRYDLLLARKAA